MDFPWHTHTSSYVFGLVRRGTVTLFKRHGTQHIKYTYHAGELFILGLHEAHRLCSSKPYSMLNFSVDAHMLSSISQRRDIVRRLWFLCNEKWISTAECKALGNALKQVKEASGAAKPATGNHALAALKTLLETHPEEKLPLNALASQTRLGKFQLIRQFRTRYGLTPHRFQIQNRLRLARLACFSAASLTDLGLMAGFYDQSHFIREFRKATGVTPGQYRQSERVFLSLRFTKAAE
ncbi:MAG: AraC family transcriptional regulator [Azoarcus sp.]|nr:AraC family transcriptional regulator [Azoarcus sp.]